MNKIKEHFHLIIIIAIFLLIVPVGYHYLYTLPNYNREKLKLAREKQEEELNFEKEKQFSMKAKCREVGRKLLEEDVKRFNEDDWQFEPEYTYNHDLNTCLYYGVYITKGDWKISTWVKDSFTNKDIIRYWEIGNNKGMRRGDICPKCVSSEERFDEQKKKLFGN